MLSADQVLQLLKVEVEERDQAAAEMLRLNRPDRAELLRQEIAIARRFIAD